MKVPTSRNPAVVRARILDAAHAEFMEHGFAAASTNRILERFGGSKPTMFRHFPTKRAMFQAVVARIAGRWQDAVAWQDFPEGDPAGWLRAYAMAVAQWNTGADNLFVGRMAVAEGHAFPEVAATYLDLAVAPIEGVLAERLANWTAAGRLRCDDPVRDARAFLDLAVGGLVSRALYRVDTMAPGALAGHVAHAVDLFLGGRAYQNCSCNGSSAGDAGGLA